MRDIRPYVSVQMKLTDGEKRKKYGSIEGWGEAAIDAILRQSDFQLLRSTDKTNYDLYDNIFDLDDIVHVCNPLGVDVQGYEFPATLAHYNRITNKINLLLGEEIKRPFRYRAIAVNAEAQTFFEQRKKELVLELLQRQFAEELQKLGMDMQDPETQEQAKRFSTYEDIEKYMRYSYQDIRESQANQALEYLIRQTNVRLQFNKGWKDLLITGKAIYWTGVVNGEPRVRRVDPRYFFYDKSAESDFIDESQWAFEVRYLTPAEISDWYYEDLDDKQLSKIDELYRTGLQLPSATPNMTLSFSESEPRLSEMFYDQDQRLVRVVHVEWVAQRKIGIVLFMDENGEMQEVQVPENYKKNEGETVEWAWINEVWEGILIGNDMYVGIRPRPDQPKSMDRPSDHKLGYTGTYFVTSLIDLMKPLQYLYNIVMYRLELTMARDGGKAFVFDLAQLPKSQGFDVTKWMYHLKALGIAFINSFEEGTGRFAGRTASFNQFQAIDLSMSRVIDQYVMMLDKIEQMMGEISGVTKQREGQIHQSELVGNTERAVTQSSHITEHLFYAHSEVKRRVLTNLLETAKIAWIDGKKLQYIADDMSRVFFSIDNKFPEADYGVFVADGQKEEQKLNTIKGLLQAALQSQQASLHEVAETLETESFADLKNKLKEMEERMQQAQAKQAEKEQALLEREQMHTEQVDLKQLELKDKELEIWKETNESDNETEQASDLERISLEREKLKADIEDKREAHKIEREKIKQDKSKPKK